MSNSLQLSGAQSSKPTKFAPIYTGRWSSGLWTNRSPLRDANTNRLTEKFYGPAGDALITGSNVEITNRLTLARRPGNPVFDGSSYNSVNRFTEFRTFDATVEEISVMIDDANALYALPSGGVRELVWEKSASAGPTFMQPVGNTLYFGNGVDNKKWLKTLKSWSSNAQWNTETTPYMSTFIIDTNGNIQQLTGCIIPISSVSVANSVITVTSTQLLDNVLSVGLSVKFPKGMNASFLSNLITPIIKVSGYTFTLAGSIDTYGPTTETNVFAKIVKGGTPISGSVQPTWSTIPLTPSLGNVSQAVTYDGTVQWTNRGDDVKNWGITAPTTAPTVSLIGYRFAWEANTFYSPASVIIDSNGNLQQVTTAGFSGNSAPTWATTIGITTTDGTSNPVIWTMVDSAIPGATTQAATPTFAPVGGSYGTSQTVTISCSTPSSTIYYTTDGSIPTQSSAVYTVPITVSTSETVNAVAIAPSFLLSNVGSASYTIGTTCAPVTYSPVAGNYSTGQSVTLSCITPASTIHYTLDGSTPTISSPSYTSPIAVGSNLTITAMAVASGFTNSSVTSATYIINGGGGTGGGGSYGGGSDVPTCFTSAVEIKTSETGCTPFELLPKNHSFEIVNNTGNHLADLLIHSYKGWMIVLDNGKFVTLDHLMQDKDKWISAEQKYKDYPRTWFEGLVYNIHVLSEKEEDKHYILFNGDVAHNNKYPGLQTPSTL